MRTSDSLPGSVLSRRAVVYVRQSTPAQVRGNLEGQRRQYDLVDIARHHGFGTVEIIDEDLGLSAGGMVARPGFERLVACLCAGDVGAVLCFEASRVADAMAARNSPNRRTRLKALRDNPRLLLVGPLPPAGRQRRSRGGSLGG